MDPRAEDVARLAGVSRSTVSNFFNHPDLLSAATREKVGRAVDDLGFVPNESARQLRAGASRALALVLLDAWLPFFNDLSHGVEDVVRSEGWSLFFSNSGRAEERELLNLEMFEAHRVQGLIITPKGKVAGRLAQLERRGMACVVIAPAEDDDRFSTVAFDDVCGGRLAGRHLLEIGRRRIAFLGNPDQVVQSADRLEGLVQACRGTAGATVRTVAVQDLTVQDGMDAAGQILLLPDAERPDAVFAANDMVATGALTVLSRAGLRVPQDVAIMGYDDVALAGQLTVPLTTVRQPAYDMGAEAARMLLRRIRDPRAAPERRVFDAELVVRESTAPDGQVS